MSNSSTKNELVVLQQQQMLLQQQAQQRKTQNKKLLLVGTGVLGVSLLVIGGVMLFRKKEDPLDAALKQQQADNEDYGSSSDNPTNPPKSKPKSKPKPQNNGGGSGSSANTSSTTSSTSNIKWITQKLPLVNPDEPFGNHIWSSDKNKRGTACNEVLLVQVFLNRFHNAKVQEDGWMGSETHKALVNIGAMSSIGIEANFTLRKLLKYTAMTENMWFSNFGISSFSGLLGLEDFGFE